MNERELQRVDLVTENGSENQSETEIDLMELFYRLMENAKRIVAAALVGMLLFALYSFILATPMYWSTCKRDGMSATDSAFYLSGLRIGSYLTSDFKEVFSTGEVQEQVLQNLNLDYEYSDLERMLKITNPSDTRILNITVTSKSAQEAASIANEFAQVASDYISNTMDTDKPSVLSRALPSKDPVSPRKLFNTALGFVLGALVMMVIVTAQFLLDDKIKTAEDIRKYVDMPTLAVVPTNGDFEHGSQLKIGKSERKQRR